MKINRILNKEETYELLGEEWKHLKHKISMLGVGESIVIEELSPLELVRLRGRICYYMMVNQCSYTLMKADDAENEWIIRRTK